MSTTANPLEYYGTGKRKTSIARVHLRPGSGDFKLNDRSLDEKFDVVATIRGGGVSAQAGAMRHGISRALCEFNSELRQRLKKAGFLMRDARIKERKKYGQKGARARFQFSKR